MLKPLGEHSPSCLVVRLGAWDGIVIGTGGVGWHRHWYWWCGMASSLELAVWDGIVIAKGGVGWHRHWNGWHSVTSITALSYNWHI